MKLIMNNLTAYDQPQQNNPDQSKRFKTSRADNQLGKGAVVFKKDTGLAFEICKVSYANGIEHFNLLCPETGSSAYLSKFALEKDYSHHDPASEKFGLRIVRRLSELSAK